MRRIHPLRSFVAILGAALGIAVAVSLLPERPYERWQLLDGTIHGKTRWIYERVHFDPRPVDVMFVGPSRVDRAVDPVQLQQILSSGGKPVRVVNFALPEGGRNINDVIVEETLSQKTPKLIVIGVIEKPSRFGHSAYKYVAPRGYWPSRATSPMWKWPGDMIYLPYRQMLLLRPISRRARRELTGRRSTRPSTTRTPPIRPSVEKPDKLSVEDWTQPASDAELHRGVTKLERGMTPPILPNGLADVEFGDDRHYVRRMVAAAQKKGVKVAFLFLPYYTGKDQETFRRKPSTDSTVLSGTPPSCATACRAVRRLRPPDHQRLTSATAWLAPQVAAAISEPASKP